MQASDSPRRRVLLFIFVISGFTGLIYESIWSHYLQLFLGHAAYAQTLVLSIFMGGLALGSWIIARYGPRIRHLLLGYALVEGLTGLLGLLFHRTFVAATDLSFDKVIPHLHSVLLIQVYKWSLAALLILPQSTLLGMTFPLISAGLIRRWPQHSGQTLSLLYFTNSLGAAVGLLVSGFVLIGLVGLPGTVMTAGLLNFVLALSVWMVTRYDPQVPTAEPPAAAVPQVKPDRLVKWLVTTAFLTGAASFTYEIGWIRMLSLVLGSSTHAFELMLSAFIFGLAFGGLHIRKWIEHIGDSSRYLGLVMLTMGGLALLTLPSSNVAFDAMAWALRTFTRTAEGYSAFNVASQAIAAAIMIPTTFCAGMALPLLTHALLRRKGTEHAVGTIYAANTLGAIAGVLLATHVLMPMTGIKGTILTGAAIHLGLGISGLMRAESVRKRLTAATAIGAILLLATAFLEFSISPLHVTSSVYRSGLASLPAGMHVRYLRDGKTATISVVESDGWTTIATNGKPDARIHMAAGEASTDEITMLLAAALPLSMHPNPARVANIGFGSGLTSHTLLLSDRVKSLDSIEIEPFMVEGARRAYFPRIHNVFEDPRSHVIYEDAKTFFASHAQPYDVIVSEPSNPWVSGVATLFSDEFYDRITHYLAPDGYLVQWIQVYETNLSVVSSIIKALGRHFPAYAIYDCDGANIVIVAARGSSLPSPGDSLFDSSRMRAELARVGISSADDLKLHLIGDQRTLSALFASMPVPINSDYFPYVDLNAPRARYLGSTAQELTDLRVIPVPVLDLLTGTRPDTGLKRPPPDDSSPFDALIARAYRLEDALVKGSIDALSPGDATNLLAIEAPAERCGDAGVQEAWFTAVEDVSYATTRYLGPQDLADVWDKILGSACYRFAGPRAMHARLLAAIAHLDTSQILGDAPAVLADREISDADRAPLVIALAAARIHAGDSKGARAVLQTTTLRRISAGNALAMQQLLALSLALQTDAPTNRPMAVGSASERSLAADAQRHRGAGVD